ncbi:PQ loop repeat protein [Ancylostoma duodenale]|uniref:PQ loop repeat protein n=1 Tax=Ancylostoma duodenale TaxID=51022 RepID=A0A0C2GAX8_9BILA|nr:PQ loop repeat protein [Ancylostoma duodenale]
MHSGRVCQQNAYRDKYVDIVNGVIAMRGDFLNAFWAWHDLASFIIALGAFTAFWSVLTAILIRFQWYVEALGMISLLVEASLGAPQLIRNWQRKSTQGMSIPMVLAWLCGDLAKTGYFVATGSPLQFWVCAILQISIDIFILGQVFVYRKNTGSSELPYSSSSPVHSVVD